jgi:hypothetical protein
MNLAHLHIAINHFPIMGVPIGVGLLALGAWARNEAIKRAALLVFVVVGIATIGVYLAGRGGVDYVEHLAGVSEATVEAHEDMAGIALFATEALALLSLVVFARFGGPAMLSRSPEAVTARSVPGWAVATVLVVGLVTSAVLGYMGLLGGRIRHTEYDPGGAPAAVDADGHEGEGDGDGD